VLGRRRVASLRVSDEYRHLLTGIGGSAARGPLSTERVLPVLFNHPIAFMWPPLHFNSKYLVATVFIALSIYFNIPSRNMSGVRLANAWKAGHPPTGISAQRQHPPLFDALTATAGSLQQLLNDGKLKSTDLVEEYVWRIEEHNLYLHAVSQYASGVMEQARIADEGRAAGVSTGPLHGIPVLLKVSIN
jgi:hypothetical protein